MMMFEKDLEMQRINLALREDFNLIDAFSMLDGEGRGTLSPTELHVSLRRVDVHATQNDCYLLFLRYNKDQDGLMKYSDFKSAFMPIDQHYARQLGSKKLAYCHSQTKTAFAYETMRHYIQVWNLMIRVEQQCEQIKQKLFSRVEFHADQAFKSCDQSFNGFVTFTDVSGFLLILPFLDALPDARVRAQHNGRGVASPNE